MLALSELLSFSLILMINYTCSMMIYLKASKVSKNKSNLVFMFLFGILLSLLCSFVRVKGLGYYRLIFIIVVFLVMFIIDFKNYYYSIPISFISLGISYGIELLSVILSGTIIYILGFNTINIFNDLFASTLQVLFTFFITKIKRLKNGFTFLENKENFGIGLLISGPLVMLQSIYKEKFDLSVIAIGLLGVFLVIIGLFLWIRSAFKRYYRKRLKLRAEEYSKIELTEKEKEIKKLSDENTSLSSIIHLDNHIIQSIESELKALNSTELTDKLLTSINQRNEYVNDLLIKSKNLASTGNADIDAVLLDLYIKSASRGIDYNLSADCDINYLLNNIISVSDFEALLRNLITNSIVDIENNPDTPGRISIKISQPNDIYELTVMDNGISKENNNSISDIIEKSNASILINKFDNNDSFTKSVTIRFDGLKIYC